MGEGPKSRMLSAYGPARHRKD
ncbi:hypothetical protein AERO9AM_70543 [Aeromicrobium sp. 9AM]|nr:hypothetical protein AERO9AM_70543 [Aeromicrobium sp. 9AM]